MKNHYDTLEITRRQFDASLTAQEVKQAYRHALLQHHPDKVNDNNTTSQNTVDAITLAYKTLSEPASKADYDRELRLYQNRLKGQEKTSFTGLDTVDLDDLQYDEVKNEWWKSCRCGQDRGFVVTEDDLEKDSRSGELIAGCRGCSLWLKILFGVEDDDGDEQVATATTKSLSSTAKPSSTATTGSRSSQRDSMSFNFSAMTGCRPFFTAVPSSHDGSIPYIGAMRRYNFEPAFNNDSTSRSGRAGFSGPTLDLVSPKA